MAKNMTIKFESHLEYQDDAVNSICDIFEGEEIFQTNFSISLRAGAQTRTEGNIGIGNSIKIIEEDMLDNIQRVQLRNGVPQSTAQSFKKEGMNFSVEMETGTGKTYVYLKTILELNRRYDFTKFIIVVPSIPIKEGTNKSLQITKEHFKSEYENVVYDYFVYDPTKLGHVRSFATSDTIQIMVINIDSFRKSFENDDENNKSNIIHRYNDKLGYKPIELIKETNPIVIIDEPQSVDSTDKAKEAIAALNPLCCLRYSATHRTPYNMMYKLDSIDAYELKLVKQIEVATAAVEGFKNDAYIDLVKVDNTSGIRAYLELDFQNKGKVERKKKWVKKGDDLFLDITGRDLYEGYIVEDIWNDGESWYMSFTSNDKVIKEGIPVGSLTDDMMKREQIRMTIEAHLDKEFILNSQGIKVLSLFFLDKVANYRVYDKEGNRQNGKYAQIFEEEYTKLIRKPKYHTLFNDLRDRNVDVSDVHNGYFSVDKQSKASNKKDKFECYIDTSGKTIKDDDAFRLIMQAKEELLSFDTPLRFIFSHSALREGWDNPNVFQICTLNETTKEMKKRQEIGRGLRLCVNQHGERVKGFEVNTLTVMANESYEEFAKLLQKEIEEDTGIAFGLLHKHSFARIIVDNTNDKPVFLDEEESSKLYNYFVQKGYVKEEIINKKTKEVAAKVQDKLKIDLKDNRIDIPKEFDYIKAPIVKVLKRVAGNFMNIKNRNDARKVTFKKEILLNEDFNALWERIKYKTTYSVNVDSDRLIEQCAKKICSEVVVGKGKFVTRKVKLAITEGGVQESEDTPRESVRVIDESVSTLPDIVTYLQNETGLTRQSVVDILFKSERLEAFKKNPQAFIESAIDIIRNEMRLLLVDGIKYRRIDDDMWCQELFENKELQGYLNSNLLKSDKSAYDYVIYDSIVERDMAKRLESSENVKVYAKLPSWFKIDTPLGPYNPDWVLVWEAEDVQKLYFVVETKGGLFDDAIKDTERKKIECGKKHFRAIDTGIRMELADNFDTLKGKIMSKL